MYLIEKDNNRILKLKEKTFTELGFTERNNLQEWIANNPSSLGEELLIIQKEFSGFSETNERLDLLALDKQGNLVIIENKLDDSGKDVTWQIIKYASYCSSLTKLEIIKIYQVYLGLDNAEQKLSEFFNKDIDELILNSGLTSQRLIIIAANFRKEVTSSVLWLMNFKMRIQCFKVSPCVLDEHLFLNIEQILPTKDSEDFAISIASKAQEENTVQDVLKNRHSIRLRFWDQFIVECGNRKNLFSNISPSKDTWIGKGIGMSGVNLNLVISKNYCRSEIYLNRGSKDENKLLFDLIFKEKDKLNNLFGEELEWERMDTKVTCRIKSELTGVNYFNESDWLVINEYMIDTSTRMDIAFKEIIKKLSKMYKNKR